MQNVMLNSFNLFYYFVCHVFLKFYFCCSVNLSPGFKNEFYPLQRGFRSFVNSAWISRGFRVDTNKC